MLIGYPLTLFIYLKDLEFKGYRIFGKFGIWDIKHYFGILKNMGIWGISRIRVYIISPCTKSRMLLSMLHGHGRLFRDTGVWIMDFGIFVESTINEALEVYLGIQGYSAF